VRIEALSRFRSRPAADSVLTGFENGTVDILIATHKLLHADARAHNLGLLIVDRSTALACATRERLKALRVKCSATLTATPIPRTLNLAQGPARAVTDQHAAGAGWPSRPCVQWHG
jgi:transcription-repair coupling factor (superfamily II helicase)